MPRRAAISLNSSVWRDDAIVAEYARASALQAPEETILYQLKSRLPSMRMLDIGVGAGRTMLHFAPRVREYWGVDCSPVMIAACALRRPRADNVRLAVCDARAMAEFPDNFFDFVLFSYNGIDYVPHRDRLDIFAEIRRVSAVDGLFCFSSHNLQHLPLNGSKTVGNLRRLKRLRSWPYALVNDGVHGGRLLTYYVNPAEQLKQLAPYYKDVKVFRLDGASVGDENSLASVDDCWLYYLCAIR
jgi:SAM-dependent methyltransferase